MNRALKLAAMGRGRTSPNPMVGAIVVRDGRLVGEGFHARAGLPHAEPLALAAANKAAKGATLYVTLEPCHHVGRTGPCTASIVAAGIRRVVVGGPDDDPRVLGRGIRFLRQQGIEVTTGVLAEPCRALNRAYHHVRSTGRPWVVAKWAQSIDGAIAGTSGQPEWLTSSPARHFVHRLRDALDGIAVGVGTVLSDNPSLTCRGLATGRNPVRAVFDSHLRTPPDARVVQLAAATEAPTLLLHGEQADAGRQRQLVDAGATLVPVASDGHGRVVLAEALRALAARGVSSLLLEGGPTVLGTAFAEQLVGQIYCFVVPRVVGGVKSPRAVLGQGAESVMAAPRLGPLQTRPIGTDLLLMADCTP